MEISSTEPGDAAPSGDQSTHDPGSARSCGEPAGGGARRSASAWPVPRELEPSSEAAEWALGGQPSREEAAKMTSARLTTGCADRAGWRGESPAPPDPVPEPSPPVLPEPGPVPSPTRPPQPDVPEPAPPVLPEPTPPTRPEPEPDAPR